MALEKMKNEICEMVKNVNENMLDDLRYVVQQYAAKSLNEKEQQRVGQEKRKEP